MRYFWMFVFGKDQWNWGGGGGGGGGGDDDDDADDDDDLYDFFTEYNYKFYNINVTSNI